VAGGGGIAWWGVLWCQAAGGKVESSSCGQCMRAREEAREAEQRRVCIV
jgi:hypothetical protein